MSSIEQSPLTVYAFYFLTIAILYYLYKNWMNGEPYSKKTASQGKVAIITGANTGIGKETAIGLAQHGVHVILACRDMHKANEARDDIIQETGNQNIKCMHLDLASFKSIRTFANEFLATGCRLNILINNAGVMGDDKQVTEDGLEQNMGVNHYGHFLLTMLLLQRLYESKPSRIINLTTWSHRLVKLHRNHKEGAKWYDPFHSYLQSKLANVYFTVELGKRLENSGVTCNAVHPGIVFTKIMRNYESFHWLFKRLFVNFFSRILFRSVKSGAQTSIYAALDFNVQTLNGVYFSNTKFGDLGKNTEDIESIEWLWRRSEEVTEVKFENCFHNTDM